MTRRLGALEPREYRWMWVYRATQAVLLLLIIVPTFVVYWPAKGVVWLFNALSDRRESFYVKCYNRDLARRNGLARKPGAAKPEGFL